MFKVIVNTMESDDRVLAGKLVITNEAEDSTVTFEGSDSLGGTIQELEEALAFFSNMPKEIKEMRSETYSVKFEGPNAKEIIIEMINFSLEKMYEIASV